jgi:small subunit ribosomal protein S16
MLKIRLSRIGKNKYATFRVVVAEHARAVKGKAVEILGSYDPHQDTAHVKADRVKYWISKGAHLSPTLHNLFVDQKIIEGKKVMAWKPPKKEASTAEAAPTETKKEEAPKPEAEKPTETTAETPKEPEKAEGSSK